MAIDDPSIQTPQAAANLQTIIQQSSQEVIKAKTDIVQSGEEQRRDAGAQIERTRAPTNVEAGVYGDLAMEAIGGPLGKMARMAKDALTIVEDQVNGGLDLEKISKDNPLISKSAKTFESMISSFTTGGSASLTERSKIAGSALTGKSEAAGDDYMPSTKGWRGTNETQMIFTRELANAQKLALAQRLQQEYAAQLSHQRMAMGMSPMGGPGMGLGLNLSQYAPKAPDFNRPEDNDHSWAGLTGTGSA